MDTSVEDASGGTRWVCPNDRHLALRAKLKTGWSVKTGSLETRWGSYPGGAGSYPGGGINRCGKSFALTEEERRTIVQVIQRAEALDLSEQERVGRLVERLENMKRNVCVIASNRAGEKRGCGSRCSGGTRCVCACALCGERFGTVLGASSNLCKDCRKYVCQKCGIEASSVGLDRANGDPSTGSSTAASTASATPALLQRSTVRNIARRTTGSPHKQFLCRICSETREMWKKSGAWFFKGMPKYVLPERKERSWSRNARRTSTWTIGGPCRSLEAEGAQDSSSDEDATRRLAVARAHSASTASLQSNREANAPRVVRPSGGQAAGGGAARATYRGKCHSVEESLSPTSEKLGKSTLSIPSQCGRLSPSGSIATLRSRSGGRSPNEPHEQRVSFEDELADDERPAARARNADSDVDADADANADGDADADDDADAGVGDGVEEAARKDDAAVAPSKASQVQSLRRELSIATPSPAQPGQPERGRAQARTPERGLEAEATRTIGPAQEKTSGNSTSNARNPASGPASTDYGTLEVSLRYDPAAQCLQCKVERARGLRPMDIHGLADPFCKLNILPVGASATSKRLRTKTVHKTCDPEFNEIVNFYGTTEADMNDKALHVLLLQDDTSGQDLLGEARFPLYELQPCQTKRYNVPLQDHFPVEREEETWGVCSSGRGRIQLTLGYCTRRKALLVTVHRATNLLSMDSNGFSDPFVKLCLTEGATDNHRQPRASNNPFSRVTGRRLGGRKSSGNRNVHNTTVKWKTLNPEWNEEFAFGTRLTDLAKLTLCLSVWDKDFGKSNDYLGGLALGCGSKGARLRHWVDAIKFPDHRHRAWHDLTDAVVPVE